MNILPHRGDRTRGRGAALVSVLAAALWLAASLDVRAQEAAPALDPELFPVPATLAENVDFWTLVYTRYDSHHVLLHDDLHVDVVYADLDFTLTDASESLSAIRKEQIRRRELEKARAKYRQVLEELASGKGGGEHEAERTRVALLLEDVPGGRAKYRDAIDRLRTQTCLKDRFATAIERSGRYLPLMEEIFAARGLPLALTRLPFVESMFHSGARSKAAAGGMWQFMPGTARSYLAMELEFDERFDPLRATEAAARLLDHNYRALQTWPLALTAYNHGRAGMERAVRQLGTRDLGRIVEKYSSRSFGFASRNFYAEFVAAARVYAERATHFPDTTPSPPLEYAEFVPDRFVALPPLAVKARLALDDLRTLNPALVADVWDGDLRLPKGYRLLVPPAHLAEVQTAYAGLAADLKSDRQVGVSYRVRSGDTLGSIARRYGTSVAQLQQANGIRDPRRLRAGQTLRIPPRATRATATRAGD